MERGFHPKFQALLLSGLLGLDVQERAYATWPWESKGEAVDQSEAGAQRRKRQE